MSLPLFRQLKVDYRYNAYDQTYEKWSEDWVFVGDPAKMVRVQIVHCGVPDQTLTPLIRALGNYAAANALERLYKKSIIAKELAGVFDDQIVALERNQNILKNGFTIEEFDPRDKPIHLKLLDCLRAHAGRT